MIEFPLLDYLVRQYEATLTPEMKARIEERLTTSIQCKKLREVITELITSRSSNVLEAITSRLAEITDDEKLLELVGPAAQTDAETFLKLLSTL